MKIEVNVKKSHIFFLIGILIISFIVLGQNPNPREFGHQYQELELRDQQGAGLVSGGDIREGTLSARNLKKLGPYVELNVLSAKNADAASCEFIIKSCASSGPLNKVCSPGYSPIPGEFGFSNFARDRDYTGSGTSGICTGSGTLGICCKTP